MGIVVARRLANSHPEEAICWDVFVKRRLELANEGVWLKHSITSYTHLFVLSIDIIKKHFTITVCISTTPVTIISIYILHKTFNHEEILSL